MGSFVTATILLWVIAAGTALALLLVLLTVSVRAGRRLLDRRRARLEHKVRPRLLEAVAGEGVPEDLVTLRGARGRAVDRLAFGYLPQVRGEGHQLLAELLRRRGTEARVISQANFPSRNRRATAAARLGLIASADSAVQLADMAARDPSQRVRIVAARGLGNTGRPEAASVLLGLLPEDLVPEGIVASALLELGPEGAPVLRKALGDDGQGREPERAMAANTLGLLDEMTAWEELAACLDDPAPAVRINAARALGRLGMPRAAPALTRCLADGENPDLRAVAARALGRIGDEHAVPALAGCLTAPGYWVAHNAAEALAALGEPGREALAEAARSGGPAVPYAREALTMAELAGARREPRLGGQRS
jgi:hypothetical protein